MHATIARPCLKASYSNLTVIRSTQLIEIKQDDLPHRHCEDAVFDSETCRLEVVKSRSVMSALRQKQTSGYFGSTLTCCSTTAGRVKAKIHGRGNRVLSDSRAPHLRQRHGFDLGANAASHCVMAEIVVPLFYSSAARPEDSGGTRRCCIYGLSTGQKLRDRGHPG